MLPYSTIRKVCAEFSGGMRASRPTTKYFSFVQIEGILTYTK